LHGETSGFDYEIASIIFTVVFILFLGIVIRSAIADGFLQATVHDPTANFKNPVAVDPSLTGINITQTSAFEPPLCLNLGSIPFLSDVGCLGAFALWLMGLPKLTTDFVWLNYLILLPMSIAVGFAVIRLIKP